MRKLSIIGLAAVTACAAVPPPGVPQHGATQGRTCVSPAAGSFVGQPATSEAGAAILRATNAAVLRWAQFGMMMTMEYRMDRVTVRLGADNRITEV
ncbi:MAG: I78 family peptidase inhibitor, partial [Sphingomicrobium sp.]